LSEERLEDLLSSAFARYDPVALGGAVGLVASLSLFLATVVLLLGDGEPLAPMLSLLGHYFFGYEVSLGGAFLGAAEAGIGGFLFGYVLARLINILVETAELSVIRKCQMLRTIDPLESGDGPSGSR